MVIIEFLPLPSPLYFPQLTSDNISYKRKNTSFIRDWNFREISLGQDVKVKLQTNKFEGGHATCSVRNRWCDKNFKGLFRFRKINFNQYHRI